MNKVRKTREKIEEVLANDVKVSMKSILKDIGDIYEDIETMSKNQGTINNSGSVVRKVRKFSVQASSREVLICVNCFDEQTGTGICHDGCDGCQPT